MRERVRFLLVICGLLLIAAGSDALKPPRPKFKIATTSTTTTTTTTEEPGEPEEPEVTTVQSDVNATTGHTLTGIPQIDYIWDPNLPRELNGYNLSSYPFYSTVPTEEINFKCDGLHDGFYASIDHKCQVYHHCLYGTRYDFLCANFTAFDQRTFICHFASEVDCENSKKYWHRNDALYQATTTTTTSTTTVAPPPTTTAPPPPPGRPLRDRETNPRRRPFRRRPAYDYYDDEYYDEEYDRTRPRGYDRRDSYEYDDRNYRNDRDRVRDRDYRDSARDHSPRHRDRDGSFGYAPSREADNQRPLHDERDQRDRDKIGRPVRRDRRPVDQFDEDSRPLVRDRPRDSDLGAYPDGGKVAASEDRRKDLPDLRARDPPRDTDDRRHSDKRYRNDYDDKDSNPVATGATDGLVKPAAPSSSVYARPRAPPKIRRPVPVSEQDKYAYNVSSVAAISPVPADEPRRRPDPVDDDYLEDDVEDSRPRRPNRRRPAYRDKEPNYDPRENRDRDRDRDRDRERNYRTRYQDENEEDTLPRKRPDRPRDRHYERGDRPHTYDRDRPAVDRGGAASPAVTERPAAVQYPGRSGERPGGLLNTRPSKTKLPIREREPPLLENEPLRKPGYHHQRTEKAFAAVNPQQTYKKQDDRDGSDAEEEPSDVAGEKRNRDKNTEQRFSEPDVIPEGPLTRPVPSSRGSQKYDDSSVDYRSGSSSDYYDEPEELPASSPRTTLRIVKRPFLPSRGGNPNPRGLKQVGSRVEPKSEERSNVRPGRTNPAPAEDDTPVTLEDRSYRRQPYDAYRTIQSDVRQQQQRDESVDSGVATRPQSRRLQKEDSSSGQDEAADQKESSPKVSDNRGDYNRQSSQLRHGEVPSESAQRESSSGIRSQENFEGQKPNEVANRLQDIPESEYDVTLNDALTPPLSQESSLPSGFILPLHRQLERDTNLQSSQRNYLLTRPAVETVAQQKPLPLPGSTGTYSVPPIVERSRNTFPRGSIFAPGNQQAPWHGFVEY